MVRGNNLRLTRDTHDARDARPAHICMRQARVCTEPFDFLLWHSTIAERCVVSWLRGHYSVVILSFKRHCAVGGG
jgi:hypothetical protein